MTYSPRIKEMPKTAKEWRDRLTLQQFEVLRKGGTEKAFTGRYCINSCALELKKKK